MINSNIKLMFREFLAEFPDYDLRVSEMVNGIRVLITKAVNGAEYYAQKDFLLGSDLPLTQDAADVIRANIPAMIAGIETEQRNTENAAAFRRDLKRGRKGTRI